MTIPDGRRILKKLRAMDRHEFADRICQEFAKRTDSLLARFHFDFKKKALGKDLQAGRFFFTPDQVEPILKMIRQRLPQHAEGIISGANQILAHRFDLLGFEALHYGQPINWCLDAVHSKQAPNKPFYQVKYLDFDEVGDSKITWELNRHQHLVTLAKAYRLTGDRRYTTEILAQWKDWHAANLYPRGINWASSLEVGFRSLSWMWVYYLLEGTEALPPIFLREWLLAQHLNGRHLERYLSTYFSPNTHLLGEGVALFFIGTLCPALSDAQRWKNLGWKIVLEESQRQVNADGLHFEQSTYYHVYALDLFLHASVLAMASGQSLPKEMEAVLEKMLDALALLCGDGPPPRLGDDDGGRVFDPARNRAEHLLDPLALGAILFNRADFKALAGDLREEAIWLTGLRGAERWDNLESKTCAPRSAALTSGGVYVMVTGVGQLVIDGGTSVSQSRGHDHADALSVCLHSKGRALLIDPGTCEYVGTSGKRNVFRGTAMHNTLLVDGYDQADPDGPFSWKQLFTTRAEQWIPGETFDLFVGSHDGYERLASPVRHQRWIVALKSGIFLVRDVASGKDSHRLEILWHLSPELCQESGQVFRFTTSDRGLAILQADGTGWVQTVKPGSWSPVYGAESPAASLAFSTTAQLPSECVSVLIPLEDRQVDSGKVVRLEQSDTSGPVHAYRYESPSASHDFFFASPGESWNVGPVSSDAEFVCLSSRPNHGNPEIVLCNGTYVEIEGHTVRTPRKVQRLEWSEREVFCSDEAALKELLASRADVKSPRP